MKNHVLSSLVSVFFFGFATAAWADYTEESRQLKADETHQVDGTLTVASGVTVDLNGYKLVYKGVKGVSGTGTITSSKEGAVLTVENTSNISQTIKLAGALKLVKQGSGTWTVPTSVVPQAFTGGVSVECGTLTTAKYGFIGDGTPYGTKPTIDVSGATVDFNGGYGYSSTTVNLNGGTIKSGRTLSNSSYDMKVKINVMVDSTFVTDSDKDYNYAGALDLNGHTLTLSFGGTFYWHPSSAVNGTLHAKKGTFYVFKKTEMPTVNLIADVAVNIAADCSVKDYTANYSGTSNAGSAVLQVSGVFTPTSDNFYPCTMMDGSTIDLSSKETTWSLSNAAGTAAQFAAGATVTIDVGVREIAAGDKIVEWSEGTEYAGREFVLKTNGATSEDFELQVSATGLTVAARGAKVPTATWTGAVNADAANPDNWSWANVPEPTPGLTPGGSLNLTPGPTTAVVIPWVKLATISWPDTADLSFATIEFAGEKPTETVVLDGDRDWRGLGPMDIPFALDLNGHKLYLVLPGAMSVNETTVTSTAEGGELHATVAADKVHDNTSVALTGNLTLIKEGPGTFVQTLTTQSYSGETRVVEGVLATASGDMSAEGVSLFGADKSVTVAAGGALDPRGSYNWSDYTIVLNGGMISNTVANIGTNNDNTQYNVSLDNVNRRFNPNVTLLKDSTFATTKTYTFFATVDSNGYELQNWIASSAEVRWQPKTKTGGKPLAMDITGGGELFILKNLSLNQPTMTLKMTDGWVTMGGNMVVSNYVAASEKNSFDYKNDTAVLKVSGTFTPTTQRFIGCTMQNGSTIDLSGKTEPWKSQGFAWGKSDVDFAEGATVTIDVHGRSFTRRTQIVKWTKTSATSAAGASFVLDAASKATGLRLVAEPYDEANPDVGGLYVERRGLVLLLQ